MVNFTHRFGILVGLSAVGYALSFSSQLLISYYFGTSSELDAYWAGLALVNVLCFYLHPLREALVPAIHREGLASSANAGRIFSAGLSLLGVLVVASAMLLWTFSERFSAWMAQAGGGKAEEAILHLLPWLIPYMGLFALSETLTSVLLSLDRAVFQAVVRLVSATVFLAVLLAGGALLGISVLVLAQLGSLAVVVAMCSVSFRALRFRPAINVVRILREGSVFPLFLSLLGSYLLANLYTLVERSSMIHLSPGLVSAFQYSTALVNVLVSVLAVPLVNLLWPRFLAGQNPEHFSSAGNMAARAGGGLFVTLIVVCTFAWEHAEQIIRLLFSRGAFDANSAGVTTSAFRAVVFASIPISIGALCGRFLVSVGNARWQILIGLANAVTGVSVIGSALAWESATIVQWHYLAANCAGMAVAIFGCARMCHLPTNVVLRSATWAVLVVSIVWFAAYLAPQIDVGRGAMQLVEGLVIDGVVFLAIASLVGGLAVLIRPARVVLLSGGPVKFGRQLV